MRDTQPKTKTVRLETPGIIACGEYLRETDYTLPADEADRLIQVKGFIEIKPAEPAAAEDAT